MRTQLRHLSLPLAGTSELLVGMTLVALLLLTFLAYKVYTNQQGVGHWILVRRRLKKEKADEDPLEAQDPLVKKGVDLEGGKRRQYVVEDLYRFKTITPPAEEVLMRQGLGRC
jgi:hypothetical protein